MTTRMTIVTEQALLCLTSAISVHASLETNIQIISTQSRGHILHETEANRKDSVRV